jgi:hypothetical protein
MQWKGTLNLPIYKEKQVTKFFHDIWQHLVYKGFSILDLNFSYLEIPYPRLTSKVKTLAEVFFMTFKMT